MRVSFTDDAGNSESLTSSATATVEPKPNSPATGQPSISGTAGAGETLTASTTGVSDGNGMTGASPSHQWQRDGDAISGATGATYTATRDDGGHTITVTVSFTDDDGYDETVTSAGVAIPVPPLTSKITAVYPPDDSGDVVNDHPGHDGTSTFTVYLEFSENISISYATVRDHVLDVTDGDVEKAQRFDPDNSDRNRVWIITIEPHGNNDVLIILAPTTDCGDTGAVCTSDGRKQSTDLEYTVRGPQ